MPEYLELKSFLQTCVFDETGIATDDASALFHEYTTKSTHLKQELSEKSTYLKALRQRRCDQYGKSHLITTEFKQEQAALYEQLRQDQEALDSFEWKRLLLGCYLRSPSLPDIPRLKQIFASNLSNPEVRQLALEKLRSYQSALEDSLESYRVVDTAHISDILNIGTVIIGSCLNVRTSHILTLSTLLSILCDGKNRVIAIYDHKNNIIARSFLRLLKLKKSGKPILVLDPLYYSPAIKAKNASTLIVAMAKKKAAEMGLSLYLSPSSPSAKTALVIGFSPLREPVEVISLAKQLGSWQVRLERIS